MARVARICQFCNNEFQALVFEVNNGKAKFCSKKCKHDSQRVDMFVFNCPNCGKKVERPLYEVRGRKGARLFCSIGCRNTLLARESRGPVQYVDDRVLIPLTQGLFAIVDREDYESIPELRELVWCAAKAESKNRHTFYAISGPSENRPKIHMHRLIMKTPDHLEVDHDDGNGLNNSRGNIRNCTRSQNIQNSYDHGRMIKTGGRKKKIKPPVDSNNKLL